MSPGIRVRHHTRRSQMLPVPFLHKPHFPGSFCHACNKTHQCKVWHAPLDDQGAVIITGPLLEDLRKVPSTVKGFPHGGFRVENPVKKPPTQSLHMPVTKLKIDGVSVDGLIHQPEDRKQYSVGPGRMQRIDDFVAEITLEFERYLDVANEAGISTDDARNLFLASLLRGPKEEAGSDG